MNPKVSSGVWVTRQCNALDLTREQLGCSVLRYPTQHPTCPPHLPHWSGGSPSCLH